MKLLLVRDPSRRLGNLRGGVDEIVSHDWFNSLNRDEYLAKDITAEWTPTISSDTDSGFFFIL